MARSVKRDAFQIPWDDAVKIAVGEERLVEGVDRKTWEGWKRQRWVPSHRMARFLYAWWRGENPPPVEDPNLGRLFAAVRTIVQNNGRVRAALEINLEVFLLAIRKPESRSHEERAPVVEQMVAEPRPREEYGRGARRPRRSQD